MPVPNMSYEPWSVKLFILLIPGDGARREGHNVRLTQKSILSTCCRMLYICNTIYVNPSINQSYSLASLNSETYCSIFIIIMICQRTFHESDTLKEDKTMSRIYLYLYLCTLYTEYSNLLSYNFQDIKKKLNEELSLKTPAKRGTLEDNLSHIISLDRVETTPQQTLLPISPLSYYPPSTFLHTKLSAECAMSQCQQLGKRDIYGCIKWMAVTSFIFCANVC